MTDPGGPVGPVLLRDSKILMRLDEITPKWISLIAYATDEAIRAKRDTLQRTLRSIFQGARGRPDGPGRAEVHAGHAARAGVLKQRLPLDQHYTTEFTPVKV